MPRRLAVGLLVCLWIPPAKAHADWLITAFLGASFASETTFLIFEEDTDRKRSKQMEYNIDHNITPKQITKTHHEILKQTTVIDNESGATWAI